MLVVVNVQPATIDDFESWIALAGEVEHLFGAMVHEPSFHDALKEALREGRAFCVRQDDAGAGAPLLGGITVMFSHNEIEWFAVSGKCRGKGVGKALLAHALSQLDARRDITVRTFDRSSEEGKPARRLYQAFGFRDHRSCDPTSTGFSTVIMIRKKEA
ncbi:GCN5-related N-acetyltransferase [anaerobic digester metagenome]|uniref:GCN5-related N-acetyltransferase n=1 Tax=anaerobic digester metagenome TaxID=1263854 RepID=A0A485LW72_9ZZZZ